MTALIPLTRGKSAIVDIADFELVSQHKWHAVKGRNGRWAAEHSFWNAEEKRRQSIHLHRFLLTAPKGKVVDHINGDALDNRRANLRIATPQENSRNSTAKGNGFKGITRCGGGWRAKIEINDQTISLGKWPTAELAAAAYNRAAKKLFGEFARLNDVSPLSEEQWSSVLDEKHASIRRLSTEIVALGGTP